MRQWSAVRTRQVAVILVLAALTLGTACGGKRRLNVMYTERQTLLTTGYSAERSQSIFKADSEAQEYCRREEKGVVFLKQDTAYQGRYPEDVTQAARAASRVARALGSEKAATASRSLSTPTDYKTTFEFQCK